MSDRTNGQCNWYSSPSSQRMPIVPALITATANNVETKISQLFMI